MGKEGMPWAEVMTGVTTGIVATAVEGEAIIPIDVEGVREVMVVAVEGWKSGDEGWRDWGVNEKVC